MKQSSTAKLNIKSAKKSASTFSSITQIHHLALLSAEPTRLANFYRKVFDLKPLSIQRANGKIRSIWFSFNGTILMIERSHLKKSARTNNGYHLLAFTIKSNSAGVWRKRLSNHKIMISTESKYSIYFNDPDGNRLALSAYPDKLST